MTEPVAGAEHAFLAGLFAELDQQGVDHAVMRNYDSLPYSSGGSDIDFLVSPAQGRMVEQILRRVAARHGAVILGQAPAPGFTKFFVLGSRQAEGRDWWGVCLDFNFGMKFDGLDLIECPDGIPHVRHNGIRVLEAPLAAVLGALKEVLRNRVLPARYLQGAREAVAADWPAITRVLQPMGERALSALKMLIAQGEAAGASDCARIREMFYRHVRSSRPLGFFLGFLLSWYFKLARYIRPSGTVVAIMGTDGAGKSTVINAIRPALDMATHNATVLRHLRPRFLPPLGRLKQAAQVSAGARVVVAPAGPVTDPHGSTPAGVLGSMVRLVYATANYVLGYWLDTRVRVAKQPTVVIFDRYAYDLFIDPRRFRIALPDRLIRCFAWFAPRPDLIFCLYGDPEVLAARKRELPVAEVARQVAALKAFAASEPRALLVDTERSVHETRDEILDALMHFVSRRAAVRDVQN